MFQGARKAAEIIVHGDAIPAMEAQQEETEERAGGRASGQVTHARFVTNRGTGLTHLLAAGWTHDQPMAG